MQNKTKNKTKTNANTQNRFAHMKTIKREVFKEARKANSLVADFLLTVLLASLQHDRQLLVEKPQWKLNIRLCEMAASRKLDIGTCVLIC